MNIVNRGKIHIIKLTKTDFIQYLNCPNSLWLLKNKPETFVEYKSEFSLFLEKLIREGYEVEEYVMKMYPKLIDLEHVDISEINDYLKNTGHYAQATLITSEGAFARFDIIESFDDGSISIYEIKSSTSIKKDKKHNHLKDIAFQKYVAEQCGYRVRDVFHVHLNKDFKKDGEINPFELISIENVNEGVADVLEETVIQIENAITHINKESIAENMCSCLENTRSNHCDTFSYFNKDIPEYSIYELNNIRAAKIIALRDIDVVKIADIPEDFKLSEYQTLQRQAVISGQTLIDKNAIDETLSGLEYPLYFFDYETLPFAVPRIDGYKPHQHLPVQYSLHVIFKNGEMKHYEYLADKLEAPIKLIETMKSQIGDKGTLISWNAPFEKSKNREMAEMYPVYADFLNDINERTFDLMDIFKKDYMDADFKGSKSIKSVQPVLFPDLSYKELDVQNGTMAVDAAERLFNMTDEKEIAELREAMLKYCELDTLAMVRIWEVLENN